MSPFKTETEGLMKVTFYVESGNIPRSHQKSSTDVLLALIVSCDHPQLQDRVRKQLGLSSFCRQGRWGKRMGNGCRHGQ
jgi:hypothetical protein